ncbi:hypothetical protein COOONC_06834 [Cooperia oncophora]
MKNTRNGGRSVLQVDWLSQFNKETTKTNDNYNMTYDYGSIMHYGGTSASFNKSQQWFRSMWIISKPLGLHSFHSSNFQCSMNTMDAKKTATKPHPSNARWADFLTHETARNASVLPSTGCGDTIKASPNWTTLENTVGLGRDEQEDFETCHYWIESPNGTEIEVRLVNFTKGLSVDGCSYAGVEIKTNEDQTLTGYRFCSPDAAGTTLRSYTNRVPIMTYNRIVKTTTVLEYRHGTCLLFLLLK